MTLASHTGSVLRALLDRSLQIEREGELVPLFRKDISISMVHPKRCDFAVVGIPQIA
jgi:hypothetical protein